MVLSSRENEDLNGLQLVNMKLYLGIKLQMEKEVNNTNRFSRDTLSRNNVVIRIECKSLD